MARETRLAMLTMTLWRSLGPVRQAAAGRLGAGGIDGAAALLDVNDLPFAINHKSGPIGEASFRNQDSVFRRYLALGEIA